MKKLAKIALGVLVGLALLGILLPDPEEAEMAEAATVTTVVEAAPDTTPDTTQPEPTQPPTTTTTASVDMCEVVTEEAIYIFDRWADDVADDGESDLGDALADTGYSIGMECGGDRSGEAMGQLIDHARDVASNHESFISRIAAGAFADSLCEHAAFDIETCGGATSSGATSSDGFSRSQENAIRKAESYLSFMAFSRTGLIEQLEYEGFDTDEATFAVDYLDVDWNEQAWKKAESYLEFTSFSRSGLIDQLKYEGFTDAEATYAVDKAGL